jgi:hypothetical protein
VFPCLLQLQAALQHAQRKHSPWMLRTIGGRQDCNAPHRISFWSRSRHERSGHIFPQTVIFLPISALPLPLALQCDRGAGAPSARPRLGEMKRAENRSLQAQGLPVAARWHPACEPFWRFGSRACRAAWKTVQGKSLRRRSQFIGDSDSFKQTVGTNWTEACICGGANRGLLQINPVQTSHDKRTRRSSISVEFWL